MRKIDYAILAELIKTSLTHQRAAISATNNEMVKLLHNKCAADLCNLAHAFASRAHVDHDRFLISCGIDL